ncbi:pseudouridine synthase [Pseudochelatococcus sp. B33]
MTDKSKNERRPARRPGGDAARTSKGATRSAGPGKFSGRPFAGGKDAGGKDAGDKTGGRRFGDGKPAGGKFGAGKFGAGKPARGEPRSGRSAGDRAEGGPSSAGKSFGGKSFGGKSFGGKSFGNKSFRDKPAGGKFAGGRPGREERPARPFRGDRAAARRPEAAFPRAAFPDVAPAEAVRPDAPERIAKAMSRAGVASRRDAEIMVAEGRVAVNGQVIDTPVTLVTSKDRIEIDGAPMPRRDRTRLWLYHKPRGLVTTARDPEGRPTVFDALPEELPRVVTIGRLDINTEGLLLLTNDGGLSRVLAHPETGWLRRYRVRAYGDIDQAQLDALSHGITIDDMHYGPVEAAIQRKQGDNVWLTLGLREGKNREVKRILEHLGLRVNRLIRVSFGPFQLGDLPEGELQEVRTRILRDQLGEKLAGEAGADFDAGSFEPSAPRPPADRPARADGAAGREGRYRSKEDFLARAPRAQRTAPAPYKREAFEERSRERAVWRDDETEGGRPRGTRVPRRGADAHAARALSAERVHERVGAITDPDGRKVKVERIVATPRLAERPARPRRERGDDTAPERASGGFRPRGERPARKFGEDRPARRFNDGERPERRGFADRGARPERAERSEGRERFAERGNRFADRGERPAERRPAREGFAAKAERSFGERSPGKGEFGKERSGRERFDRGNADKRPFDKRDDRPAGKSFTGKSFTGKSFTGKSFGGKPFAGKPFGGKSSAGKSSAGKSGAGRPSAGRPSSGRPGGGSRPPRKY